MENEPTFSIKLDLKQKDLCKKMHNISSAYDILKVLLAEVQYDKHTLHSNNLYQIFTYVKNKEYELRDKQHEVAGMLLYAKTEEEIQPNQKYKMSGNRISVRTLDLNLNFAEIRKQLDRIVDEHFEEEI